MRVFRGEVEGAKLKDRLEAATWLADRAFGKPVQAMNVETFQVDLSKLSDEQLERLERGEPLASVLGDPSQD